MDSLAKETVMASGTCRTVLMIGPDETAKGGIAAVVSGYWKAGLFEEFPITYVRTHTDGPSRVKLAIAISGWLKTLRQLLRFRASLLHVHLSSRASFWRKLPFCLLGRVFGRPYILHLHGGEFINFYEREIGPIGRAWVRSTFDHAAVVLALSNQWKTALSGITSNSRIVVLPNCVFMPDSRGAPADDERHRIVCFGRIKQRKGTYDLIHAFASIAAEFPCATLVCAGDGEVQAAKQLVDQLDLKSRVELPGWLDADQIKLELAKASIFVLPSYAEGIPMALLEAMSWSLPVITTPVGGIPQVVEDGINGLMVEPGKVEALANSLRRLLSDRSERERIGIAARETIRKHYSIDIAMSTLRAVYGRFKIPNKADSIA